MCFIYSATLILYEYNGSFCATLQRVFHFLQNVSQASRGVFLNGWTHYNLPAYLLFFIKYGKVFIGDSKQEGYVLPWGVCVCMNFSDERQNKASAHTTYTFPSSSVGNTVFVARGPEHTWLQLTTWKTGICTDITYTTRYLKPRRIPTPTFSCPSRAIRGCICWCVQT